MANLAHQILMGKFVAIAGSAGIPVLTDANTPIFNGENGYRKNQYEYKSIKKGYWKTTRVPHYAYLNKEGSLKVRVYRETKSYQCAVLERIPYVDYGYAMNEALEGWGYNHLGHGFFSAVYADSQDDSIVYKVGFKKEDSGAAYAAFCRANQGCAGIPIIHNIATLTTGQYVVMMDKLESNHELPRFIKRLVSSLNNIISYGSFCFTEVGEGEPAIREAVFKYLNKFKKDWEEKKPDEDGDCRIEGYGWCFKSTLEKDTPIIEYYLNNFEYLIEYAVTATRIHEYFKGIASFDVHDGNWMLNKDGLPVITDPVSFTRG